jgi:pimeloyl-ACP methyl ester carboxylesterase
MRRHDFLRDGLRLSVAEGTGSAPVVFQHGLCGSADQTFDAFPVDKHFRCVTVECRGHGLSEAGDPAQFSIDSFTDDVAAYMSRSAISPCIVGGISMGAAIALRMAVKYPDRVKAIALVRPAWIVDPSPPNNAPNREVGNLLAALPPRQAQEAFLNGKTAAMLRQDAPDNLASLTGFFTREPVATTGALLRAIASDGPGVTATDLARISVPVLIVAHGKDFIHPIASARELQQLIPSARLIQITPKAVDKKAYTSELRGALLDFFKDVTQ